jgi:uroporphyrinogen decarboxylase
VNSKERVINTLNFKRPDRIPKFDSFWSEFRDKCIQELNLPKDIDIAHYFNIDIAIAVADESPFPSKREVISDNSRERIERDSWGRVIRTARGGYFYEEMDVSVKNWQALEKEKFDSPYLDSRYSGFVRVVNSLRDKRCVFCKTGGPYIRTSFLRGKSSFLMDIAGDPEFAKAMADKVADHITEIGKESLKRGNLYDTGLWIYDDMAYNHGTMMSPKSFERIFLPAYKRMVKAFKDVGAAKVILHSDGNITPVLDMLMEAGIDGINPVEPKAGLHIPTLRKKYGNKLSLIGGMCNSHVLPRGTRAEIEKQAMDIIQVAEDGGVIIGAHSIGPDIPLQNYIFYHETVMKKGVWSTNSDQI